MAAFCREFLGVHDEDVACVGVEWLCDEGQEVSHDIRQTLSPVVFTWPTLEYGACLISAPGNAMPLSLMCTNHSYRLVILALITLMLNRS